MNNEINKPSAVTFDEERLQRAVPFRLEKTTMPGVFTIPAPPPGFDPRTARPSELIQAGFPWKRPDAQSDPVARALWDRVMAREWRRAEAVPAYRRGRRRRLHLPGQRRKAPISIQTGLARSSRREHGRSRGRLAGPANQQAVRSCC